MKLIFMGSPAFAVPSLKALVAAGHEMVAVYTQPPRPAGRGQKMTPTAVQVCAEALGLGALVRSPERLRGEALEEVLAVDCDAICVVAYGLLLPKRLVDSRVCLNVHPSALPRWRGAAPIQHTVMAGDTTTEVCIMRLDEGMDTGPVYSRTPLPVPPEMTAGDLHDVCAEVGARELVNVVGKLDVLTPVPQIGEATLAPKMTAEMRRIDWGRSALEIHNLVRALAPVPGAVGVVGGEEIKVLGARVLGARGQAAPVGSVVGTSEGIDIACGDGVLRILSLQRAGKKAMGALEALRGWKVGEQDVRNH